MCDACEHDRSLPDPPSIPDGALSDLVELANDWVQSVRDKIDHLGREHDDLRAELSGGALLNEMRLELRSLKDAHATFCNALQTFRAIEEKRTEGLIAEAVRRVLAERKNGHD
jgi:hypothetical protein